MSHLLWRMEEDEEDVSSHEEEFNGREKTKPIFIVQHVMPQCLIELEDFLEGEFDLLKHVSRKEQEPKQEHKQEQQAVKMQKTETPVVVFVPFPDVRSSSLLRYRQLNMAPRLVTTPHNYF